MTNRNKAAGTKWESDIVSYLKSHGIPTAHRVAQTGRDDSGDIWGVSPFIVQAKTYANLADGLRLGLEGAKRQAHVAGEPFGAAVVKRRGKGAADAYVVMDLETFTRMLIDLRTDPRIYIN
jgi:hypothetical protein